MSAALQTRAPWWTPKWVDEKVTQRLHHEATAWVKDIRDDERHPARLALDDLLRQLADDLQNDPETKEKAERLKQRLLSHPQVTTSAVSLWKAIERSLLESLADPESAIRSRAIAALADFGRRLGESIAMATS